MERCDNEKELFNAEEIMDKLDKCYIWHIITLATMKYKLKNLKGVR